MIRSFLYVFGSRERHSKLKNRYVHSIGTDTKRRHCCLLFLFFFFFFFFCVGCDDHAKSSDRWLLGSLLSAVVRLLAPPPPCPPPPPPPPLRPARAWCPLQCLLAKTVGVLSPGVGRSEECAQEFAPQSHIHSGLKLETNRN